MPTFIGSSSGGSAGVATSVTVSRTVAAGSDRLFVGAAAWRAAGFVSLTFNAVELLNATALTAGTAGSVANARGRVGFLTDANLTAGGHTADYVLTVDTSQRLAIGCGNFTDVDQTTPIGTPGTTEDAAAAGSIAAAAASTTSDLVFSAVGYNGQALDPTITSDGTDRWLQNFSGTQSRLFNGGATKAGAASSTTVTWTISDATARAAWAYTVAIKPVSAGGGTFTRLVGGSGPGMKLAGFGGGLAG